MSRERRRGGPVLAAGLGGFVLGAATVLLVVWAYGVYGPAAPAPEAAGAPGELGRQGAAPPAPGAIGTPGGAPRRPGSVQAPETAPPQPSPQGAVQGPGSPQVPPGAVSEPEAATTDVLDLRRRRLLMPVQGVRPEQLVESFHDARGGHQHEAMDILAPRNTPVLAVEDGRLAKLFFSRQGGNTVYQFDPSETYAYYYAHLERYADGLREGAQLQRGQVIGFVGSSGNAAANAPHLHFAIFHLGPEKSWWRGTAIDPFSVLSQQ
jgi:peptidoglycan LD-endopeptidase LytH